MAWNSRFCLSTSLASVEIWSSAVYVEAVCEKAGRLLLFWSNDLLPAGACHPAGGGDALAIGLGSLEEYLLLVGEEAGDNVSFSNLKSYSSEIDLADHFHNQTWNTPTRSDRFYTLVIM